MYDHIRDYKQFYQFVRSKIPRGDKAGAVPKCYLLLDEVQQAEHWEKAVNSLNIETDIDVDIYITGSNACLLSSDISTLLSGRYVEIKMLPLSFKEFLQFEHTAEPAPGSALGAGSANDIGHVLETVVYFELLRRGYQVFVGKWYTAEVDFFAVRQGTKKYYQVTLSMVNEAVRERELASLSAIHDNYEKIVLSLDKSYITDCDGIKFQNIIDFLLEAYD